MTVVLDSALTSKGVADALNRLAYKDADYWEFKQSSERDGVHGLMQYPAMMVPKMQGVVIDTLLAISPHIRNVCDPFVGAGTTLVECISRGLNFSGFDINPLAILLCTGKSQRFASRSFEGKVGDALARLAADSRKTVDVRFPGREKWFSSRASVELSRIRRSVIAEPDKWARQIMWTVFAETIRKTSNARTSTYKLHIRSLEQQDVAPLPSAIFSLELQRAVEKLAFHEEYLCKKGLLTRGVYSGKVNLSCRDIRSVSEGQKFDLVITSPPYGDNRSTVAYGQFSYLALNWIPREDLDGDASLYSSAYATDSKSLGGSWVDADRKSAVLLSISQSYAKYQCLLAKQRRKDLEAKVASFMYDFFDALTSISRQTMSGGYHVWTLGDRTVGGISVPFTEICREMQESLGLKHVTTVTRNIPSKRTPSRNSEGKTMSMERLLVMRK
jgi:hypothetical protein